MPLPIRQPLEPMEAGTEPEVPGGGGWQYEPKWDGFRCIIFRHGDKVALQSRNCRPLARYFPGIEAAAREARCPDFVLDGELVIPAGRRLDFEQLQLRLHPAESRVRKLADESPATFVAFDLLAIGDRSLLDLPLSERRPALEAFAECLEAPRFRLSPATPDRAEALRWLESSGRSLDGVVAKRLASRYKAGEREMIKVKNLHSVDCVVGGYRMASSGKRIGSLLLGLFDDAGRLDHVGFLSAIPADTRAGLLDKLRGLECGPGFTGRSPGGPSRWARDRSGDYHALQHELVVEVEHDQVTGGRFRHGTRFRRWRPDKPAKQCTAAQLHAPHDLALELLARR